MTNNNLPEWANSAFEQAGVSTDGWDSRPQDFCEDTLAYIEAPTTIYVHRYTDGFTVGFGAMEFYGRPRMCFSQAFHLADRLKRAVLDEPDPRVAELEAINKELYDALETLVSVCENHALVETVFESLVSPNEILNQAKAALAKARGEKQ